MKQALSISPKTNSLIHHLSRTLHLKEQYASDAGVYEGYTIEEHTRYVLTLFEYYYESGELPLGLSAEDWRICLALHDVLGKPEALKAGDKTTQHRYLYDNLPLALRVLGYSSPDISLAQCLFANDCIGEYVQEKISLAQAVEYVRELSTVTRYDMRQALSAFIIYWTVDAGAYTSEVAPIGLLDHLFAFDRSRRKITYNTSIQAAFRRLQLAID